MQVGREVVGGELVVRRAGDGAAAQGGHRVVVEHAAQRAGRDDVHVGAQRLGGLGPGGAQLLGQRAPAGRDVGQDEPGAGGGEAAGERAAHVAQADHRDAAAGQVRRAPDALGRDADRGLDAERGPRAGIARAAALVREPGDVRGPLGDDGHVLVGRAHVLGGDVAPGELLDAVAEVEQRVAAAGRARAAGRRRAA